MQAIALAVLLWAAHLTGAALETNQDSRCPLFASEHQRFGINIARNHGKNISHYDAAQFGAGWYLDYTAQMDPLTPGGMRFLQVLPGRGFDPESQSVNVGRIEALVEANPGAVWVVGNEPDRPDMQDSLTPEAFAVYYHDVYRTIKRREPTAQVAIGGIVQPTPIRLRYLDRVLDAYRQRYRTPLPADIWTIHNFILREGERMWGAGIPPGLEAFADEGMLYDLDDHGRLDLFQAQIIGFRRWMAERGYQQTPLWVTEYGILLPDFYGYPEDVVKEYMLATFDWMRTASDPATGYAADDNRLVQAWGWYSLNDKVYDPDSGIGFNGNLLDYDSGEITDLGEAFAAYVNPLVDHHGDPLVWSVTVRGESFVPSGQPLSLTVDVRLANAGTLPVGGAQVTVWAGEVGNGQPLATQAVPELPPTCALGVVTVSVPWQATLTPGPHRLVAEVSGGADDRRLENNRADTVLVALPPGQTVQRTYLPTVHR